MKFYEVLNSINQTINGPIMNLIKSLNFPVLTVFLLGILGSTAPCQITTNLGAIGLITKESGDKKKLLQSTLYYTTGKVVVFLFYGLLIMIFNVEIQKVSIPIFSFIRKFMGLFVILIGLYILGVINLKGSIGNSLLNNMEGYIKKYKILHPSFIMGVIFSLAFCPTLFWLFFGIVVPLSIKSSFGVIFPVIFALGTLIPLIVIVIGLAFGKESAKGNIKSLRKFEKPVKMLGGIILIAFGIIDSLIYWFG